MDLKTIADIMAFNMAGWGHLNLLASFESSKRQVLRSVCSTDSHLCFPSGIGRSNPSDGVLPRFSSDLYDVIKAQDILGMI